LNKRYYNPEFLAEALKEAKKGNEEGGIPIGSVIVHKDKIIGRGHNRRLQIIIRFYMLKWMLCRTQAGNHCLYI